MSTPLVAANPYDDVPYPAHPLWQSHPVRLAAIATMLDMRPEPVDRCRVLELGCATGGNLIPMADRFRESTFVGIDYSQVQIDTARQAAQALGLSNVELHHASITELGDELGKFDYIICHGVYSWVPRDVQDKILEYCRASLSLQGVAFVSYNIYPGWHVRSTIRRLIFDPAGQTAPGVERIARGLALLKCLSGALAGDTTPLAKLLKDLVDPVLRERREYLCHEFLESDNLPLYFHEFVDRAAACGLQYLGDTIPATMFDLNPRPAVEQHVRRITDDPIEIQQHWDLLQNRPFCQTLLCHREVTPSRRIMIERLGGLYFAGEFTLSGGLPDLKSTAAETFTSRKGAVTQQIPLLKAVLYYLGSQWPRGVSIEALVDGVAQLMASQGQPAGAPTELGELVKRVIAEAVGRGLVDPTSAPDGFTTTVSGRPLASPVAQLQSQSSRTVTNRRHEPVKLDDAARIMLPYLDGKRDHAALVGELLEVLTRREVALPPGFAGPVGDISDAMSGALQQWLTSLARQALLIA
jgi:SAM-dependent methyltransferase